MKSTALVLFLMLSLFHETQASEGKKYPELAGFTNVTITRVEKDGVRVTHDSGAGKIPIEKLPEDVRTELGLTMEGVAKHRAEIARAEAAQANVEARAAALKSVAEKGFNVILEGEVLSVATDGILIQISSFWDGVSYRDETKTIKVGNGLSGYHDQTVATGKKYPKPVYFPERKLVFVKCDSSSYVDDAPVKQMKVWPNGKHRYQTAGGAAATVPAYTTNPKDLLE